MIHSEASKHELYRSEIGLRGLYKAVSLAFSIIFAVVGLIFLCIPAEVLRLFNSLSIALGFSDAPLEGAGFFLILAVGYMYLVALLALLMFRHPENRLLSFSLINAKSASSVVSLLFFIFFHPYLIFLANCLVDGSIAAFVTVLHLKMKLERP